MSEEINAKEYIRLLKESYKNYGDAYVVCSSLERIQGFSIVIKENSGQYILKRGSLIRTSAGLRGLASISDSDLKIKNKIKLTRINVRSGMQVQLDRVEEDFECKSLTQIVKLTCGVSTMGKYVHKLSDEYNTINMSGKEIYATYNDIVIRINADSNIKPLQGLDGISTDEINLDNFEEVCGVTLGLNKWMGSFDPTFQKTFVLSDHIVRVPIKVVDNLLEHSTDIEIGTSWDANEHVAHTSFTKEHYTATGEAVASALSEKTLRVELVHTEDEDKTSVENEYTVEKVPYTAEDFNREIVLPNNITLNGLKALLKIKNSLLFTAPPGTGKTTAAIALANTILGEKESDRLTLMSFNQATEYSDVVSGLRQDKNGIWKNVNGTIKNVCEQAEKDTEQKYIIIIDEINRGNTLEALGEYLTAMSKIGEKVVCNTGETIVMPKNVYIIATMNTVDSSVTKLDAALRDRFAIVEMKAKEFTVESIRGDRGDTPELKRAIKLVIDYINAINKILAKDIIKGKENQLGMRQLYTDYDTVDELMLVVKTCIKPQIDAMSINLDKTDIEETKEANSKDEKDEKDEKDSINGLTSKLIKALTGLAAEETDSE